MGTLMVRFIIGTPLTLGNYALMYGMFQPILIEPFWKTT